MKSYLYKNEFFSLEKIRKVTLYIDRPEIYLNYEDGAFTIIDLKGEEKETAKKVFNEICEKLTQTP